MAKPLDGEILDKDAKTPVDDVKMARDEQRVQTGFWRTLKKAIRVIPFSNELVAAYYCALDGRTPVRVRATLLGALAYFVLPLDALPDFIAGFGFTDDITVLAAVFATVRQHITEEHRAQAKVALDDLERKLDA